MEGLSESRSIEEPAIADTTRLEVFDPAGVAKPVGPCAPRLTDLRGKTICELSNHVAFRQNETFSILEESLRKNYPGIKFVSYNEFPSTLFPEVSGFIPKDLTAGMLIEKGCEAVISGNGG